MQGLELKKGQYPSGQLYYDFYLDGKKIGIVTEVNGGYLVQGKKKPRPTAIEAAKQIIDDRLN